MNHQNNVSGFLSSVVQELIAARIQAGLTQEQIADRVHTKQSAIARLEKNVHGSFSLRRIADYALACGMIPCMLDETMEFHLISLDDALAFTLANTHERCTWRKYLAWKVRELLKDAEPTQRYSTTDRKEIAA